MSTTEFQKIAEQALQAIQDAIDNSGADIDYDEVGGVLTLEFADGGKIIFSQQAALQQLWMAARTGGFHFGYDAYKRQWLCDNGSGEELFHMLSRLASEQAGEDVLLRNAPGG